MVRALRTFLNGVVVVVALLVVLPAALVGERVLRGGGGGRRVALPMLRVVVRLLGVRVRVVVEGAHDALGGADHVVLVPNHSSPFDIVALLLAQPDLRFAGAAELFRVPLLGGVIRAFGTIPVERSSPAAAYRTLVEAVAAARSLRLVVFAEGQIPPVGEPMAFKSGPFGLAVATGATIVPVAIAGTGAVLPRGSKVWVRPGTVTVRFLPAVATDGLGPRDRKRLRDETERAVAAALDSLRP